MTTAFLMADAVVLMVGFTIVAAAILTVAYLRFLPGMRKSPLSKAACVLFLGAVAGLQWYYFGYFQDGTQRSL